MKIKLDHVTNSSSSSFIVAFPHIINDLSDVSGLIAGSRKLEKEKVVFRDACKQKPILLDLNDIDCIKYITDQVATGHFAGMPEYYKLENEICDKHGIERGEYLKPINQHVRDEFYIVYDKKRFRVAKEMAKNFTKSNSGKYLYIFEYGDDTDLGSELEHGGTFNYLSHITISHH